MTLRFEGGDGDSDTASHLNRVLGITTLEEEANKEAEAQGTRKKKTGLLNRGHEDEDDEIIYSVWVECCHDPDKIRKYLDDGLLDTIAPLPLIDGYDLVLLCACAMDMGCKVRPMFRMRVKEEIDSLLPRAGVFEEAAEQMYVAIKTYKSGVPLNAGGIEVTVSYPNLDGEIRYHWNAKEKAKWIAQMIAKGKPAETWSAHLGPDAGKIEENMFGDDECAGCGVDKGEGGAEMLACGQCGKRKYCGKLCQKEHLKLHGKVCEQLKGDSENEKQDGTVAKKRRVG